MTKYYSDEAIKKMAQIPNQFIHYPEAENTLAALENSLRLGRTGAALRHMFLVGQTGVGKTQSLKYILARNQRSIGDEQVIIPVLRYEFGGGGSERLHRARLLQEISPIYSKKLPDASKFDETIKVLFQNCQTRMICFDEGERLIRNKGVNLAGITDLILSVIDNAPCSVVISGTEDVVRMLDKDSRLRGRISNVHHIRAFDGNSVEDLGALAGIIAEFEDLVGLERGSEIFSEQVLRSTCFAINGAMRQLAKMLSDAVGSVVTDGRKRIEITDLSAAYIRTITFASQANNPFVNPGMVRPLTRPGEPYAPEH